MKADPPPLHRRPYVRPTVSVHGTVQSITRSVGMGMINDNAGMTGFNNKTN